MKRFAALGAFLACALAESSPTETSLNTISASSSSGLSSSSQSSSGSLTRSYQAVSYSPIGSTITNPSVTVPTGSYSALTTTFSVSKNATTGSSSSSSNPYIIAGGTVSSSTTSTVTGSNSTASSTTTSAAPTNTQPCNDYVEFCSRQYSNITGIAAHNAAFAVKNNAFSNQAVSIIGQLNDGIRMIQGEVHYVNSTLYNCHSSCNFLNAGTYESLLVTVREWVQANPYNVITLLISNSDNANVTAFAQPFEDSGILPYVYYPPKQPMLISDWPTLEEMILESNRVVVLMDFNADASLVPYIIPQYSTLWQTPFSPTDPSFPCTQEQPPDISEAEARNDYMYVANHNLNVEISLLGSDILIPDFSSLAVVNADNSSESSLLTMAENCDAMWGRPPNWLIVDFYEVGGGSVFEVAAQMNNVTYTRSCCAMDTSLNAGIIVAPSIFIAGIFVAATLFLNV